jgi:hypothetical protein
MIRKSVFLPLPPSGAFRLFTARVSEWWPPQNRHTADAQSTLHLLESGRFYERSRDGQEVELGRVLVWEEARRIVLDFYVATGPDHPTRAEVQFEEVSGGTRVTITHGPKPCSADQWLQRAPRYESAWERVLAALAAAAHPSA